MMVEPLGCGAEPHECPYLLQGFGCWCGKVRPLGDSPRARMPLPLGQQCGLRPPLGGASRLDPVRLSRGCAFLVSASVSIGTIIVLVMALAGCSARVEFLRPAPVAAPAVTQTEGEEDALATSGRIVRCGVTNKRIRGALGGQITTETTGCL